MYLSNVLGACVRERVVGGTACIAGIDLFRRVVYQPERLAGGGTARQSTLCMWRIYITRFLLGVC
jgi:hypothetical protein